MRPTCHSRVGSSLQVFRTHDLLLCPHWQILDLTVLSHSNLTRGAAGRKVEALLRREKKISLSQPLTFSKNL